MVFQSSIGDKSQPDSISSDVKKQTLKTIWNKQTHQTTLKVWGAWLLPISSSYPSLLFKLSFFFYFYCLSFKDLEWEESADLIIRSLLLHHSLRTNSHEVAYKVHNVLYCLIPPLYCGTFFPPWPGTVCNDLCLCTKWYIIQQSVNNSFNTAASAR